MRVNKIKKANTITLPNWLTLKRLVVLSALTPIILPLVFMTLIWGNDQYRHGSLYAMCDRMPIGREFVPLRREVFQHGCYTKSICDDDIFTVSQVLARYEVISLKHCLRDRTQRPDKAIIRFIRELNQPKPKPQINLPEVQYEVQMAETASAP